jgi:two-component system chemotaxis sensor kinase CheA
MTSPDPELLRLLIQELERHAPALEQRPRDHAAALRALHALKGSSGLAGERELAASLERLHRRAREGEEAALDEAALTVRTAVRRLSAGERAVAARWPVPPDDLVPRPFDPLVRAQYAAEVADRLSQIDDALSGRGTDPLEDARAVYRHLHTMKGAASAVGDEPMSWFCHGLEERLKGVDAVDAARAALDEVGRWRVVLGALLDEPETALATLRGPGRGPSPSPVPPSGPARGFESEPPRPSIFDEATATIRIPAVDVDRLLERFDLLDRVREGVADRAARGLEAAALVRDLRGDLADALRAIGPPRPWGAPAAALERIERVAAALGRLRDDLGAGSARLHATEQLMRDGVADAKRQLSAMRQTTVGRLFGRLTTAIESEARRSGRAVIVRTRGADENIDRRLAEELVEPCLQLVRNAVAHGIETPAARIALGKPPSGTISLGASKKGNRLSITIEDDGAGVDVAGVRALAVQTGQVTQALAEAADDDTLLSLLFLPGFSTRESSDLLAGRGIGLEIARGGVHRLRGAIRLFTRAGAGFTARIDVPIEAGLVRVLWVEAGGHELAVLAANARRVRSNEGPEAAHVPHLAACLDGEATAPARYAIDLDLHGDEGMQPSASVGVDAVGPTEEVLVRPLGSLVGALGPFSGAVVRGYGALRLAIDAWVIVPRARALAAAIARSSSPPRPESPAAAP